MNHKIHLIIKNTYRELLSKKTPYFLVFVTLLVSVAFGTQIYYIFDAAPTQDPEAIIARKANVIWQILSMWSGFSILFGIIYAAGSVQNERKEKTLLGVLSKPIGRWEFLAGKLLGVIGFFGAFYLVGILLCAGLMLFWNVSFTPLFLTGLFYQFVILVVFSAISFVLSLFVPPVGGGGLAFILWTLSSQFEGLMESSFASIRVIGTALFYLSPALIDQNLIENGILDNVIDPSFGLYWGVIAENILYAVLIFYIGAIIYKKKDIILG